MPAEVQNPNEAEEQLDPFGEDYSDVGEIATSFSQPVDDSDDDLDQLQNEANQDRVEASEEWRQRSLQEQAEQDNKAAQVNPEQSNQQLQQEANQDKYDASPEGQREKLQQSADRDAQAAQAKQNPNDPRNIRRQKPGETPDAVAGQNKRPDAASIARPGNLSPNAQPATGQSGQGGKVGNNPANNFASKAAEIKKKIADKRAQGEKPGLKEQAKATTDKVRDQAAKAAIEAGADFLGLGPVVAAGLKRLYDFLPKDKIEKYGVRIVLIQFLAPIIGFLGIIILIVIIITLNQSAGSGDRPGAVAAGFGIVAGPNCVSDTLKETTTYVGGSGDPDVEGGIHDSTGKVILHTLEGYLAGKYVDSPEGNYAGLASDLWTPKNGGDANHYTYGDKVYIPALEKKLGKPIEFRVVDTGSDFGNIESPGPNARKNPDRGPNGQQYFDISTSDPVYINGGNGDLGNLSLKSTDSNKIEFFVGNGCTRDGSGNYTATGGDAPVGTVTAIPADKGICSFCTQKPLPADAPGINKNYAMPKALILHYLGGNSNSGPDLSVEGAYNQFRGSMYGPDTKQRYVQFAIDKSGTIFQFMAETKQVAGAEKFNVFNGGVTISIENEGHFEREGPSHAYTEAQVNANVKLVKYLMEKYGIPPKDVITHMIADCRAIQAGKRQHFHRTDPGLPFAHAVLGKLGINNGGEEATCAALKKRVGVGQN